MVDDVFLTIESLRKSFTALCTDRDHRVTWQDLAAFRPLVLEALGQPSSLIAGSGVALSPNLHADAALWLEWWRTTDGGIEMLEVSLQPDSGDFYNYTAADWYREPELTGRRCITGPYVDYLSMDQYIITHTVPMSTAGRFLGVAGADVLAGRLEVRLLPGLLAIGTPAVILHESGRVLASSTDQLFAGRLVPVATSRRRLNINGMNWATYPIPNTPWHLAVAS